MWSRPEVKEHLTYALEFAPKVFKYFENDYYKVKQPLHKMGK